MHTRPLQAVMAPLVGLEVLELTRKAFERTPMATLTRYEQIEH